MGRERSVATNAYAFRFPSCEAESGSAQRSNVLDDNVLRTFNQDGAAVGTIVDEAVSPNSRVADFYEVQFKGDECASCQVYHGIGGYKKIPVSDQAVC